MKSRAKTTSDLLLQEFTSGLVSIHMVLLSFQQQNAKISVLMCTHARLDLIVDCAFEFGLVGTSFR